MEKEKSIKNGTKKILYTGKEIYTDSLRTLQEKFNATRIDGASLSEFNSYKPFYVSKPTEKEKETCLCIHWLNPHLFLKSINKFWKSDVKHEYQSLTTHLEELSNIDKDDNSLFSEKKIKKYVITYMNRKTECYKGKDRNDAKKMSEKYPN